MSKENKPSSIWQTIEKTATGLVPREPILPVETWTKYLKTEASEDSPLLILCVSSTKDVEKFGFKKERYNKDVFNRTSVIQALRKMQKTIPRELFYATGKHSKIGCPVVVVGLKEWIEKHDFVAKSLKVPPKKREPKAKAEATATVEEAPQIETAPSVEKGVATEKRGIETE